MSTQLYRIPEAAERLGVNRSHIYRLINTGQLRKTHVGSGSRSTRISEEALAEFVARNTSGSRRSRRAS